MSVNEMKLYLSEYKRLKQRSDRLIRDIEISPDEKQFLMPLLNSISAKTEDIMEKISSVSQNEYREILIRKYIYGETLEEIAEKLCYSSRHLQRIIKRAVASIEEVDCR